MNFTRRKDFFKKFLHAEWLIVITALAIGIYAYYPSLVNHYVIADDIRICTYWVGQFYDKGLFQDDLLTEYAKYHEPWGFHALYFLVSWLIDPILFGTILSIGLLALAAFYLYKLGNDLVGRFGGLLAALTFLVTPLYVGRMAGGIPRSFGYPLLIMFLYYLIKRYYWKTAVVLILQCLFYPLVFTWPI